MYLVLYIETCGTKNIKSIMSDKDFGDLMSNLDYEVIKHIHIGGNE